MAFPDMIETARLILPPYAPRNLAGYVAIEVGVTYGGLVSEEHSRDGHWEGRRQYYRLEIKDGKIA